MKGTLRFLITWVIGVTLAILLSSWLRNEEVQWPLLIGLISIGLVVALIIAGTMMYLDKAKDRPDE